MIYTFSDSEWEMINKAWRHVQHEVSGIIRARVDAVLASMQVDHAIYSTKQLERVIWILSIVSRVSHADINEKSQQTVRQQPEIHKSSNRLKDIMTQLLVVLQYYQDANRKHDLSMCYKK